MKRLLKVLATVVAGVGGGLMPSAYGAQDYDLAAIVWPAYQPEPRWAELGLFGDGKGEWQNVYECKRCARPLWGYENEADPTVVARKIDAALAAGVNVFIYDWYWYGGRPFLEEGLDNGFLKAPNCERMKFYIMYANHDVDQTWNNRIPTKDKGKILWPAKISDADWTEIVRRLIAYFKLPNYYTIEGKPVFWLYRSDDFIAWEGLEKAQARLKYLRDEVAKAGFPGLHLQISASASAQHLVERLPEHIRDVGADTVTTYNWAYRTWDQILSPQNPVMTYRAWGELAMKNMAEADVWSKKAGAYMVPNLTMGFCNCSRWPEPESLTRRGVEGRNPQEFEMFARRVRKWVDKNTKPGHPKLVIVNSWNEWTEDSYLEPDDKFGYGYLNALWRAFSTEPSAFVSQARWLWSEPADNPPTNAYVRIAFNVDAPVKSAWFYRFADRRYTDFVNGKRVKLHLWPSLRDKYRGHVKGEGIDLLPLLRKGRNVIGFQLQRFELWRTYGVMLRGEVVFEDGRVLKLFSNPSMAKASPDCEDGWADPEFDDSAWKPAWSRGDVRMGSWTDYGSVAKIYMEEDEYKRYYAAATAGFPEKKLLSEPKATEAKVVYSGDVPGISINGGKPMPPDRLACVRLTEDACQDALLAKARDHGLWAFSIGITHRFQCGDGSFDFSDIDRLVRHILSIWPEAYFYCVFSTREEVKKWLEKHPDECVRYALEDPKKSKSYGDFFGNPFVPSFASAAYRAEVRRLILDFGRYASSQPWGRRVLGMNDGYGGSLDGMPFGCHSMPDTGKRMTEAFRRYLTEKYRTDNALRKSWNDPSVTLATAAVPDAKTRGGSGSFLRDFADPRDRRRADYLEAYHREFNAFELEFCKAVKEAFPGHRLAGLYYGYVVLSYEPEGSTARFEELLKSPYVDYMLGTTRGYNFGDGLHRHLHSVFHRYGKLSSIEGDVRTHLGLVYGDSERKWTCLTPEETRATVGKYTMNARMFGTGWHAVDFSTKKWSNCPEALETMAASRKVWEADFADPPAKAADVAVVFEPNQVWREGPPSLRKTRSYQEHLVTFPLQTLNFSGFANDLFAPEDYVSSGRRYRAVIFLNTCYDTPALRKAAQKARADGAMSIWCATPGLSTPSGWSAASMHEITGIRLGFERDAHPFQAAGTEDHAGYEPHRYVYVPNADWTESPRVFVDDSDAKVSARWKDNGQAAFAVKRLADGTDAVFLGMPYNTVSQWAELLASAGCHAFTPPGFMVRRNSRRLMVFSARGGNTSYEISVLENQMSQSEQIQVKLERPYARVRDSLTGEIVAENAQTFTLTSDVTRLWMLETLE